MKSYKLILNKGKMAKMADDAQIEAYRAMYNEKFAAQGEARLSELAKCGYALESVLEAERISFGKKAMAKILSKEEAEPTEYIGSMPLKGRNDFTCFYTQIIDLGEIKVIFDGHIINFANKDNRVLGVEIKPYTHSSIIVFNEDGTGIKVCRSFIPFIGDEELDFNQHWGQQEEDEEEDDED